jgi:hypothetical protein
MNQCRICGMVVKNNHQGAVDCINALRQWVIELQALLPIGEQVLRASLSREASARVWIEGPITCDGLARLIKFIEFMREAWTEEAERPKQESCDPSRSITEAIENALPEHLETQATPAVRQATESDEPIVTQKA